MGPTGHAPPLRTVARILVRGVNWLGDAVMTTPALLQLRAANPHAHISLLTSEKLADLWSNHPAVDALIVPSRGESLRRVAERIRPHQFELGIVFPNSPRSAAELWLGRVPRRLGYAASWRRWFLTEALPHPPGYRAMRKRSTREIRTLLAELEPVDLAPPAPTAHHIHHYLHLTAATGADPRPVPPQLFVTSAETTHAAARFGLPTPGGSRIPLFGINAGAEYGPAKRWPRDRFVAVAAAVQRRIECAWVILGGPGDIELGTAIAAELASLSGPQVVDRREPTPRVHNLAGRTSLRELCAALALCRVVLTNDTGPMHVAAAVGTPVVVPFGSTSAELTGPGLPGDQRSRFLSAPVPCRPCFRRECPVDLRCMHGITVEEVVKAVLEVTGQP